jgi:hypothetical protein
MQDAEPSFHSISRPNFEGHVFDNPDIRCFCVTSTNPVLKGLLAVSPLYVQSPGPITLFAFLYYLYWYLHQPLSATEQHAVVTDEPYLRSTFDARVRDCVPDDNDSSDQRCRIDALGSSFALSGVQLLRVAGIFVLEVNVCPLQTNFDSQ